MDRLIGIARTNRGLMALLSRQVQNVDAALHETETKSLAAYQTSCYQIVEQRLDASLKILIPDQSQLMEAWNALTHVEMFDTVTLYRLLTILIRTVSQEMETAPLALLPGHGTEPARPKPTAAHPRAYQGTKTKPPKPKLPSGINICSALGASGEVAALLKCFAPQWREAIELLRKNGHVVSENADFFTRLVHAESDLPLVFRLSLWPLLRDEKPSVVNECRALYWELGLEEHPDLLASVTHLVGLQCRGWTPAWGEVIRSLPREQRVIFTDCLIQTGAYHVDPKVLVGDHFDELTALFEGHHALHRLYHLLRGLKDGIAPDYLFAGFRVADRIHPKHDFEDTRQGRDYPEQTVRRLMAHLEDRENTYGWYELEIWKRCGDFPGLGKVLETIDWTPYEPATAYEYVRLYTDEFIHEFAAPRVELLERHVRAVPQEYQAKFLTNLRGIFWFAETAETIVERLPFVCKLLTRLAQSPFKHDRDTGRVLVDFLEHLDAVERDALLAAPNGSFQRLEEACRRTNDSQLIGTGTWSLLRHAGQFSLTCFLDYPAKFFRVAKLLGCLPNETRDQVVRAFQETPLMQEPVPSLPLDALCRLLDAQCPSELISPVSRRLREHLSGLRPLTSEALVTRQAELHHRTNLTRLEILERMALHVLQDGFSVSTRSDAVRHALQILRGTEENRKALRKFLRAYWSGDTDYPCNHPRSQEWLARHSSIHLNTWVEGLSFHRETVTHGMVKIALEQDPLEALRLGTYVGSCLGLGGWLSYSAAAVVLDINKQVLYARDAHGVVIARQVVAISEEEQLVCFSVYPLGVSDGVKQIFADYNRLFAQALSLPLHLLNADENYTIAAILSHGWWDDGAWEGKKRRE